jgi:hypothetical protein
MKPGDIIVGAAFLAVLVGAGFYILPMIPSAAKYSITAVTDPAAVLPPDESAMLGLEKKRPTSTAAMPSLASAPKHDFEKIRARADRLDNHATQTEKATLAIYDQINLPDAPGYAEGRLAVQLYVYFVAAGDPAGSSLYQTAAYNARAALEKGSRDPLLEAMVGTFCFDSDGFCDPSKPHYARHRKVVLQLQETPYPADIRLAPLLTMMWNVKRHLLTSYKNSAVLAYGPKYRAAGLKILEQLSQAGASAPPRVCRNAAIHLAQHTTYDGGIRAGYEREIERTLVRNNAPPVVLAAVRGQFLIDRAKHAENNEEEDAAKNRQIKTECLATAERDLEAACAQFPKAAVLSDLLMSVELAQGKGRDRMERYFAAAIAADPGRYDSYENKILYLQPRWHGSTEDVLAFGKECLDGNLWRTNVPLILIDAMETLEETDPEIRDDPEAQALLKRMYTEYLAIYPNSVKYRGLYLKFLLHIGDFKEARKQDEILKDWWDLRQFSPDERENIRRMLKRA